MATRKSRTVVHVNQHAASRNRRTGDAEPCVAVRKRHGNATYHSAVEVRGCSHLVFSPLRPLACGARVWLETDADVVEAAETDVAAPRNVLRVDRKHVRRTARLASTDPDHAECVSCVSVTAGDTVRFGRAATILGPCRVLQGPTGVRIETSADVVLLGEDA